MEKQRSLEAAEMKHPNKIGFRDGLGYAFGDAANLFVLTYVSSYLKVFYTDILKVAENKITTLLLIARLWDAINDPLWGNIVAKKRPNKDGKFRPYIKWFAVPLGIMAALCFVNFRDFTASETLVIALMYITYIGYGMMYTTINIPYGSLASVITDDPDGRTLLSTFRSIGAGLGGAVPLLIGPMVIYTVTGTNSQGVAVKAADAGGMLKFGVIMGVLSIIFFFLCFTNTKERVASEEEPQVDIKKTYIGMLKSRPFVVAALSGILISGQLQFASLNQYLYKNFFENTDLSIIGTIANYLPMAVMIFFMPKLVKKFGKQELCSVGTFFSAVAAVLMFFIVPHCDRLGSGPVVFMIFTFIIGFGYSFVSITNWAIITDVIDYQEYKTGIRSESAVYAVYTFCRNLGQTIADVGGMKLLGAVAGYNGAIHGSAGYVEGVGEGILFVCTIIPAIVYTLVFILFKFGYPLNKSKLDVMYKDLRVRREVTE
ncbi:MAG: glycoside-pentoside-hexuronide (GPH):cation symporter [Acutalibacteraceae bacterium]|nr:glycoside-pentoside-hexuronide (GPH):cation symporter [Acutalibacteraceae bacterium]